jgi:hypothetical protein
LSLLWPACPELAEGSLSKGVFNNITSSFNRPCPELVEGIRTTSYKLHQFFHETPFGLYATRRGIFMTKIDLSQPLNLPTSMVSLTSLASKDHKIEVGEGHLERQYDEMLAEISLQLPYAEDDVYHVYYSYAAVVPSEEERKELISYLLERGIGVFTMYPALVPLQGASQDMGYSEEDFPESASYARRVTNLPMFETLREDEIRRTVETILAFYDRM